MAFYHYFSPYMYIQSVIQCLYDVLSLAGWRRCAAGGLAAPVWVGHGQVHQSIAASCDEVLRKGVYTMSEVSTIRLYLLRAMYVFMFVGLAIFKWPGILNPRQAYRTRAPSLGA